MDSDLDIDIEIDDDMNGIAVIRCPECDTESRVPLDSLSDGSIVECSCGFTITVQGDGFAAAQRDFDDLKAMLDDL